MSSFGTRTLLELRVAKNRTVEVLVHLRRRDVEWFNASGEAHQRELRRLVGEKILPKEFEQELTPQREKKDSEIVGEVNKKQKAKAGTKRKRTKKEREKEEKESQSEERKYDRQVFGEALQLLYRLEPIRPYQSALLLYKNTDTTSNEETNVTTKGGQPDVSFRQPPKLSKRIAMWCYPYDPKNPIEPLEGGGFPRPEMIPISSLFRSLE